MKRKTKPPRKRKVLRARADRGRAKPKPSALGSSIRTTRENRGLTQLALAHAIGYTGEDAGAYISRVESGTQAPRLDTLQRIANALNVAVCALIGEQ